MCPPAAPSENADGGMSVANRNGKLALNAISPAIPDAKACKSHLCLKRAVFPPDELCGDVAKEDVEHEINEIVYANREKEVIRKECFGDRINSKRLGFIQQRYSCGEKAYDEKREEVIAY